MFAALFLYLLSRVSALYIQPSTRYKVEVSYFEIYSERIYDLLLPETRANKTKVRGRIMLLSVYHARACS